MMEDMYRVFRYGVVRILEGEDALLEQLRARARYWNRLVEIEQAYRAECERIMHADPRVADLEQRIQALADDNRQELRALRRDLREAQRAARQDARVQEQLQQAATQRTAAVRVARHQYGLYWGNYLDVEMMYRAARGRNGHRLRFTPTNTGEGAVSVWFQHGLPTSWVWGRDSRLMMDPLPAGVWETHRTHHDPRLRTTVRLRVGSTTERQPIYVVAMVVMHRPLPEEGLIRHASIVRRRIGGRVRYQLCITVAVPPPAPRTSGDVIGVDLGWRRLDEGAQLRVAYAVGSDYEHELRLPETLMREFQQVSELQAVRDRRFNDARIELLGNLQGLDVPDWLREAITSLRQWRSPARLAALCLRWRERRFPGDDVAYNALESWRQRDRHLWEWQANLRDQAIARRNDLYHQFAAEIARRARVVVLEDMDLTHLVQQAQTDSIPVTRRMRMIAGVGILRQIVEMTCLREGVAVVRAPSQYTTQDCHLDGTRDRFDAIEEISHRWPCGHVWDQDVNAAENLRRYGERWLTEQAP